jgi:nucleoside-triphosphatase THEP1
VDAAPPKILLTGPPRVGKTTCIERLLERLDVAAAGFVTREVRRGGKRVGFDVESLDGRRGTLARTGKSSPWRVGRYGVDLESFESVALPALEGGLASGALVVIDEIGKMELFSEAFKELVARALESPAPLVGTVMVGNPPFVRRIKARQDVILVEVTQANRDGLHEELAVRLGAALKL